MYHEVEPLRAENAFTHDSEDAQLSQAAFLMGTGLVIGGYRETMDDPSDFVFPDFARMESKPKVGVQEAVAYLDVDLDTHISKDLPDLPRELGPKLAAEVVESAEPRAALALIEASTHSVYSIVRTCAAASAINASEAREDLVKILEEEVRSDDPLTSDVAATALANHDPEHPALAALVEDETEPGEQRPPTTTAFITHGTWARRRTWWRPRGGFYSYVNTLSQLTLHNQSFGWSGSYRHPGRVTASVQLLNWVSNQGLNVPDMIAHSHGGTVAHLATNTGLDLDRLVLLSWPVHTKWFPDFARIRRIVSFRVNLDLVIMADRGRQRFVPPPAHAAKVAEHVNGWFSHSATHDPDYWRRYGLPNLL